MARSWYNLATVANSLNTNKVLTRNNNYSRATALEWLNRLVADWHKACHRWWHVYLFTHVRLCMSLWLMQSNWAPVVERISRSDSTMWRCSRCIDVCGDVGVCDNTCVWSRAWALSLLHDEVIAHWPFCRGKVGEQWCLLQKGECGNQLAGAQRMGVGVKRWGKCSRSPNNQHVHVFTGWPSSTGGCRTEQVAGSQGANGSSGQRHTAPSCRMMDELCSLLKITRWNHSMRCQNMYSAWYWIQQHGAHEWVRMSCCVRVWDCEKNVLFNICIVKYSNQLMKAKLNWQINF